MIEFIKKTSFTFLMSILLMMSISCVMASELPDFDLDNIPQSISLHVDQNIVLPSEEPDGEYGRWEIVSGQTRAKLFQGRLFAPEKTGTVKVMYEANDGTEHTLSIKIVNHKFDKTTNRCDCGALRPVSSIKLKKTSYVFDKNMDSVDMSKYLKVTPASTASNVGWYVNTVSSWYGARIASISYGDGELTVNNLGVGIIRAVDSASGKEAQTGFAIFNKELQSQYVVCLDESITLPVAVKEAKWEVKSGENKLEDIFESGYQFKGIKTGTAKLVYSTDVGDFTTKIKVAKHKFDRKTGVCSVCGAKQPPKKFEFTESTFVLSGGEYDLTSSKYFDLQPTNADVDLEWYIKTSKSWYGGKVAEITDEGILEVNPAEIGYAEVVVLDKKSGINATVEIISDIALAEKNGIHVDRGVRLPYVAYSDGWEIVKGDKYVEMWSRDWVHGLKSGTAKLECVTPLGNTLQTTVKVSNHKFDKTTGVCSCGAKQPPKKFEFNESTYILGGGEYDLTSSKYFNLQPTNADVDLMWYISASESWYGSELATISDEGILSVNPLELGYAEINVVDRNTNSHAKFELIADISLEEKYQIHIGQGVRLPYIAFSDGWEITSGGKYVAAYGRNYVEGVKSGTVKLECITPLGNELKTSVKVSNHKYDRETGECECGATLPIKALDFNESTYILSEGTYDLSASKYLNIEPTSANVDLSWYLRIIRKWYKSDLATIEDGILEVEDNSGYGEVVVKDEISGLEAKCEIIIPASGCEEWKDEYEVHLGKRINLPTVLDGDKWEIISGDKYIELILDGGTIGKTIGSANVRYTTPTGNTLNVKIKVADHTFDSNGECSCGEQSIEIPDRPIEVLEAFGIMTGYPDGTFKAGKTMNRAEAAKLLVALMNIEEIGEEEKESSFNDELLKDGEAFAWARGYAEIVNDLGVLKGYPDGSFGPEKPITNAEFFTCIIRILGYADVVEVEGTWPTNVILKCRELGLTDDAPYKSSSDQLTRGVAAVVCYNTLGTQMWKVTTENEGSGMTSCIDAQYASVKFPDFVYSIDAVVEDITVNGNSVIIEIKDEEKNKNVTGEVVDIELLELAAGMNVTTLYDRNKDRCILFYNDEYIVEGLVTEVTDENVEIDGKTYNYGEKYLSNDFARYDYVVSAREGKDLKAVAWLPLESTLVERVAQAEKEIGEDTLVIIDGEWTSVDDIEVGDVYTEIDNYGDPFYVVSRDRDDGTFEGIVEEETEDYISVFVSVDGREIEIVENILEVYEGEDNDEKVDLVDLKEKDNKYLNNEVEVLYNYAGVPVYLLFGEVADVDSGNFYAMLSNGPWTESTSKGESWYVELEDVNGEQDVYQLTAEAAEEISHLEDEYYYLLSADTENAMPFFWAKQNEDGVIEEIAELANGGTYGDYSTFLFEEGLDDDNYLDNEWKVTSSTIVVTAMPELDSNGSVIGVNLEISEGADDLENVKTGIVAYRESVTEKAEYVFVTKKVSEVEIKYDIISSVSDSGKGVKFVELLIEDLGEVEVSEDSISVEEGDFVVYKLSDDIITIIDSIKPIDIDDERIPMITDITDGVLTFSLDNVDSIDTQNKSVIKEYKDVLFMFVDAMRNGDDMVEFCEIFTDGLGIEDVEFYVGDRVIFDEIDDVVIIISGISASDSIKDGVVTEGIEF